MKKWWKKYKFFVLAIFLVVVMAGIYGYREYNRGLADTHNLKPAFKIEASDFVGKFESNEPQANALYADKAVSVHGVISSIQTTDTSATVFLNDGSSVTSVMCQFGKGNNEQIKNLRKGEVITIKGICSGYLLDVVMVRCVVDQ
jgi:tRNA_anti-like